MNRRALACWAGAAALCACLSARAELLDAQGNAPGMSNPAPLFEDVQFITGSSTLVSSFSVAAAGTYTVTLTDFMFPGAFENLALAITSATTTFGSISAPGTFDIVLGGPMQLFALVFGVPGAESGVGLYGVSVALGDSGGGGEPVPLPATAWLLLSALAATVIRRRHGSCVVP